MREGFRALHRLGQNFLVDRNVLADIVARADVRNGDVVLEVGPGHGVLTRALLERGARVHAVELDQRLRPELEALAAERGDRLSLVWGDAMRVDYEALSPLPNKVVANIPYNITTPLIWRLLALAPLSLNYHLYMVQREAALRLTAPPGTKERYPLGVTLEVMGRATRVRSVPPSCFRPQPKVDSALAEIVLERRLELGRDGLWNGLLRRGFAHRRKTLMNNLKGFGGANWAELLARTGINPSARAEDLGGGAWLELHRLCRENLSEN